MLEDSFYQFNVSFNFLKKSPYKFNHVVSEIYTYV